MAMGDYSKEYKDVPKWSSNSIAVTLSDGSVVNSPYEGGLYIDNLVEPLPMENNYIKWDSWTWISPDYQWSPVTITADGFLNEQVEEFRPDTVMDFD